MKAFCHVVAERWPTRRRPSRGAGIVAWGFYPVQPPASTTRSCHRRSPFVVPPSGRITCTPNARSPALMRNRMRPIYSASRRRYHEPEHLVRFPCGLGSELNARLAAQPPPKSSKSGPIHLLTKIHERKYIIRRLRRKFVRRHGAVRHVGGPCSLFDNLTPIKLPHSAAVRACRSAITCIFPGTPLRTSTLKPEGWNNLRYVIQPESPSRLALAIMGRDAPNRNTRKGRFASRCPALAAPNRRPRQLCGAIESTRGSSPARRSTP